jgi:phosphoribosylamine--glycine ligase
MTAAGVPKPERLDEPRAPCVVKADGLAAGKGVVVCRTQAEADEALARVRGLGDAIVVEELLEGPEVSLFALCDGRRALALPAARDAKRLLNDDEGPNTGGMGAYSPVSEIDAERAAALVEEIHVPVLAELDRRGTPFAGLLYAGLMLTDDGPRVLEFNCRFGDPETQAVVPRLEAGFATALAAAAAGDLGGVVVEARPEAAVTVVVAAAGYPDAPVAGDRIEGIEDAEGLGALVFHAGTALRDGATVSAGGRVLGVTGLGATTDEARDLAYAGVDAIRLEGSHARRDIAENRAHVAT